MDVPLADLGVAHTVRHPELMTRAYYRANTHGRIALVVFGVGVVDRRQASARRNLHMTYSETTESPLRAGI